MKKRMLGRTGIKVSELALGGLFISRHGSEFDDARAAVQRAVELGINYVDTAPTYSNSEEVLGRIIADIDAPLIISTKLGGRPQPFEPKNKDCLRRSFDESLKLLNRKHIDLLMIHEPDRSGQYDWWADSDLFNGPVLEFLDELKSQGLVKFIGLGGTTAYEMPRIIATNRFDVVLTAFNYSLLWREAELEVLPAAVRHEMGIIIGSPLQQGALSKRYDDAVNSGAPWLSTPRRNQFKALYKFLDECSIPIAEMGMRFVISNPDISCVLTGARSAREVEANVAAVEKGPLPPDVLKRLDEIARMVPFRPYEEPFGLPFHSAHPNRVGIA
jgi:aryl-alcohol dehydrogenase-like predicted oxidoreductase